MSRDEIRRMVVVTAAGLLVGVLAAGLPDDPPALRVDHGPTPATTSPTESTAP